MATLTKLPSLAVIDGFKGVVDFYVSRGLNCARRWPRSPGHRRAPSVEAQWLAFTTATRLWKQLPSHIQDAYRELSHGTTLSGYEWFLRSYISGIIYKPPPP